MIVKPIASHGKWGQTVPARPPHPVRQSWAQVVAASARDLDNSPLHNRAILAKLKDSTSEFIRFDGDTMARAHLKFQNSLYGKFFGKPHPFEQVKSFLYAKWIEYGEVSIFDLPNGYLLIRCGSHQTMQKLLTKGPWSINGIILQLSSW